MTMTVKDFGDLSIEPSFQMVDLYDVDKGDIIFHGTFDELLDEEENFLDMEVGSFDVIDENAPRLTLNVSVA